MPITYTIEAEVIDITKDTPSTDDAFLVDTNVWFWLTYERATLGDFSPRKYQAEDYPNFIFKALNNESKLLRCGLSLPELAHLIEKTEREIFRKTNGEVTTKEYRQNYPSERSNVVEQISLAWEQVKSIGVPLETLSLSEHTTDRALNRLTTQLLDGYDIFIAEALSEAGIVQVITDDGDYASIPNLQIYTSNKSVIEAARIQGKLITR